MASRQLYCLLSVTFLFVFFELRSQNRTYYYERIKEVSTAGAASSSSGDGHFITITPSACYESDREGIAIDRNVQRLVSSPDANYHYVGDSYYGNASYFFSLDYSRLNIKKPDGIIYVYERRKAPDSVGNNMRRYRPVPSDNVSTSTSISPIVIINSGYTETTVPITIESSPSGSSATYSRRVCKYCKGTGIGRIKKEYTVRYTNDKTYCYECNAVDYPHAHIAEPCGVCRGRKYLD